MESEYVIAIVIVVSLLATFIFAAFSVKKSGPLNEVIRTPTRKSCFTLPPLTAESKSDTSRDSIMSRLRLTRDSGCVITISLDSQV